MVASVLRFTGLNWDEGQWIHPDEGHMRMITAVIRPPDGLGQYFDTQHSPLNSRNSGYTYSYGTLPLFLTRFTAQWLDDHLCGEASGTATVQIIGQLTGVIKAPCYPGTFSGPRSAEVGRALSALADMGSLLLLYLLGRRLYGEGVGLLALALGVFTAFTIQQAHFFTVDSMAAFFTLFTAYWAARAAQADVRGRPAWISFGLAGLTTGLATACKISSFMTGGLVALAGLWWWIRAARQGRDRHWASPLLRILPALALAGVLSLVAFRIAQPYAFEGPGFFDVRPDAAWLERLGQIGSEQSGELDYPSGRQWTNRMPLLFPWVNMVVWGMGFPLGLAAWAGWLLVGRELLRGKGQHLVLWAWGSLVFLYQATRWVKAMRYFLPLYPLFILFAAYGLVRLCRASLPRWRRVGLVLSGAVVLGAVVWGGAVVSIYTRPHPRIAASRWIFDNVPVGVTVANEHWDWGLPLRLDGRDPFGSMYQGFEMEHYNEDTPEKREQLYGWLDRADYIFLASNRLYGSIPRLPARYPLTTAYYAALFSGRLGFELAADFTSSPALGPFQFPDQENPFPLMPAAYVQQREPISIPLPPAEESFSVYDHPRVLIFRKTPAYSRALAEQVMGSVDLSRVRYGQTPMEATGRFIMLAHDTRVYVGLVLVFLAGWGVHRATLHEPRSVPQRKSI
jgi:hypothetical protein